ncbi:hypothetical protein ACIBBB_33240 [Streptomyces sp. NPDC051217]|uniref:hypothetical protein n=1 Tax=Streptomyces sp. NPDC051217 TaxID=3365644 RepID=UPI00378E1181
MFRTTRCSAVSAAIVATAALLLSGCSSSSTDAASSSASASDGAQDMDAYRQCLEEQGVTLPGGRPGGRPSDRPSGRPSDRPSGAAGNGGGGGFGGGQSADPEFQKAEEACASLRPQGGGGGGGNADASAVAAFTSCMKDHGVELPSASPGSEGDVVDGLNTADTKTAAAYTACEDLLPQSSTDQPAPSASSSS